MKRQSRKANRRYEQIVQHLRETLTAEMVAKAYRCRHGQEIDDSQYDAFVDELISEHYNAELDDWDDEYLYYD